MARFFKKKERESRSEKRQRHRNERIGRAAVVVGGDLANEYAKIGRIVDRVNYIELRINRIIAEFYVSPNKQQAFLDDFMFAGRLRLNDKLKIFKAILKRKNISFDEASFERWIHIRNMVAHGVPSKDNTTRRGILQFNGNIYNIENEFRDFEKLQSRMEALIEIACDNCNHRQF